jgi:drug/metabolite transporter (DMT)-like permease
MNEGKATLAVIGAGALWGIISIFINHLSAVGLDPIQIGACRAMICAPVVFLLVLKIDRKLLRIDIRDIWIFICMGLGSIVLFSTLYFYTIVNSEASVAVALLYTSPIFIMLLSAIFFKEKITRTKLIALALTFGGCVFVSGIAGGTHHVAFHVLLAGIGSGLFYGLYSIFGKVALKKYDSLTTTFYTFLIAAIGYIPIGDFKTAMPIFAEDRSLVFWIIGMALLNSVIPYFLYTWGLQRLEPGKAGIFVAVEPLVGCVVGMTLFHESTEALKLIGIAMIIAAIVLLSGYRGINKRYNN